MCLRQIRNTASKPTILMLNIPGGACIQNIYFNSPERTLWGIEIYTLKPTITNMAATQFFSFHTLIGNLNILSLTNTAGFLKSTSNRSKSLFEFRVHLFCCFKVKFWKLFVRLTTKLQSTLSPTKLYYLTKDYCLLGCKAVPSSISLPRFRRNLLRVSSGYRTQ
jgi:hypothetical protein